ncbi:MAG: ferrous iron transport protein A [Candidatus Azotimanducaceae bacterium]|jgi:ferrous iron transport protein A
MTLSEMTENSQYRVVSAAVDNPEIQSRLYALGVYPGVTIEVLRFAPTGNPIQIRIGRSLLSIRKSEAQLISVEQST